MFMMYVCMICLKFAPGICYKLLAKRESGSCFICLFFVSVFSLHYVPPLSLLLEYTRTYITLILMSLSFCSFRNSEEKREAGEESREEGEREEV